MARTTINLSDEIIDKIKVIADRDNRSVPNLIETILIEHIHEGYFVDDFEMEEINRDKKLKAEIVKSNQDYKKGRGRFV